MNQDFARIDFQKIIGTQLDEGCWAIRTLEAKSADNNDAGCVVSLVIKRNVC